MKKYGYVGLLAFCLVLLPCVSHATLPARAIALDASSIAWGAGGAQLLNTTWKAGNIVKTFRSSFSPASLGYVLASVIGSWALEHWGNEGIASIRSYLATAGFTCTGSGCTMPGEGTGYGFVGGTQEATDAATIYSTWGGSGGAWVVQNADTIAQQSYDCHHSGACTYDSPVNGNGGTVSYYGLTLTAGGRRMWMWPNVSGRNVVGMAAPPIPASLADIGTKAGVDLTAGDPLARAAVAEAEGVIEKAFGGQPWIDISQNPPVAFPTTGAMDKTAPGLPGTLDTPRKAIEVPAAAAIGQPLIDMGTAADTQPGEVTPPNVVPDARPYVDPGYAGTYTKAAWDTVDGFGTRLASFTNSIKSTGLFQIPGGMFQGIPSGGSSSFTINGGSNFGTHTVDLAGWSSLLLILRACFLLGFAYCSVKIVIVH